MSSMTDFHSAVMSDPLVLDTWDRKYRHKDPDGTSHEATVYDTRRRVVEGVYKNDPNTGERDKAIYAVSEGLLIPAGRINAGAGIDRSTTLINCFVSETVQDSMPGIQRSISRAALTMQQGGGIGTDFSTIRPRGALASRTAAVASGVIPFMDQQDAMCQTIVSGGQRRGAMMGTLRDDHPDLWCPDQFEMITNYSGASVLLNPSFISAKRQPGRLTQFNLSVLISDAFLRARDAGEMWDLGHHEPPASGVYIDVQQRPFTHDKWRENNSIFVGVDPGSVGNIIKQERLIQKGELRPWYVYRRVPARQVWEDIMHSTYTYAEPGVIFIDRINLRNNLYYCEDIRTTNPCGEQPLPPHGICCLGSVNMAMMVDDPFTPEATFNVGLYLDTIRIGVRFLDNVLDVARYPLEEQEREAQNKRRIGLGVTGWGNALLMMGARYGDEQSVDLSRWAGRLLRDCSYEASMELAKERGSFPLFDRDKFMAGYNIQRLPIALQGKIYENGIRNGVLNTIAPNGTISLYVGNVSSGHEPVFSFNKSIRKVRQNDGRLREYESMDYGRRLYEHLCGDTALPDYFVGAMDISPEDHLTVHAAWQEFIDSSISKTINCPESMTFKQFERVYDRAWELGCKGCTTYRPDPTSGRGSVLSEVAPATAAAQPAQATEPSQAVHGSVQHVVTPRPPVLEGRTYKLKWPLDGGNWYVNITGHDGMPMEVFITSSDAAAQEWIQALSRMMTAVLRRGGDVRFLVDQLGQVVSSSGGAFITEQKRYRGSVVAAISGILEEEFRRLGMYDAVSSVVTDPEKQSWPSIYAGAQAIFEEVSVSSGVGTRCPECTSHTLIKEAGCNRCLSCGYNSCG